MSCAALDWHCSQITRLWFHIPHLHIHTAQWFILQIPWPQEAAIMFLHPDHSLASLALLNRAFVGCHVRLSGGTWEHLLPAVLVPTSPGPLLRATSDTLCGCSSHTLQCVFLLHIGPSAIGETNCKTAHSQQSKAPTPFFTYDVFSMQSCIFQGRNYSSRTMYFIPLK